MYFSLRVIVSLISALSLFSLAQQLAGFSVTPAMEKTVTMYRSVSYPFADWINSTLSNASSFFRLDSIYIPSDMIVLYLTIGFSIARLHAVTASNKVKGGKGYFASFFLFWPAYVLYEKMSGRNQAEIYRFWKMEERLVLSSALVLFLLNFAER